MLTAGMGANLGRRARLVILVALASVACGLAPAGGTSSGKVEVVAAENFWGSIAEQVGGDRAHVTSLIANPDTDPHDYEATPRDAQLLARAGYVIFNGAGYDAWAPKLLAANPVAGRRTLDVGALVGVPEGGNPHVWYSHGYVSEVIDRLSADLKQLDPADAGYFDSQSRAYGTLALKDYSATLASIRQKYAGAPVGASESIFVYTAEATGLNLVTPPGYMKAVSEGTDPSAADRVTVDEQVSKRQIRVFLFNSQNSTPDVQGVVGRARAAGIPVVQFTETLAPANLTFQDWQTRQLQALLAALGG